MIPAKMKKDGTMSKPRLIWSKQANSYRENSRKYFVTNRKAFSQLKSMVEKPYLVGFHFVRASEKLFDFHNMVQTVSDIMTDCDWLYDDNIEEFIPVPLKNDIGKYWSIDRDEPGVYIKMIIKKK